MTIPTPDSSGMGKGRTILLTAHDRVEANELALLLGVSSSELIEEFEQLTPEEQAEFEQLVEKANEALPEMLASLDRIEESILRCRSTVRETGQQMSAMSRRVARIEESLGIAEAR